MASSAQPILARQLGDSRKFALIIGDEREAQNDALRSDEQIVTADRFPISLEPRAKAPVFAIDRNCKGKNFQNTKHCFELLREPRRVFLDRPVPEFGCDDDARANVGIAHQSHPLRRSTLRISNEIRNDVRIE